MTSPPDPGAGSTRFDAGEPKRCDCVCHTTLGFAHFAACCATCERCGVRFSGGLAKHRLGCTAEPRG